MCRHYQALSWQFQCRFMARHGTSPMSYSRHFSWHLDGTPKNMAPHTFMAFSRHLPPKFQHYHNSIYHVHVTLMSLSWYFSSILNLKDKPYACQIHVTLMALSLKLLDCHDSVYHIHVRSMSFSQSGESAMKLERIRHPNSLKCQLQLSCLFS